MASTMSSPFPMSHPGTSHPGLSCPAEREGLPEAPRREEEEEQGNGQRRRWWKFELRPYQDDDEASWWFASTAIPLIAAALGPMANVFSLAALVTYWRMWVVDPDTGALLSYSDGIPIPDPQWCYWLNVASLICGFVGNFFLLFNFTQRVRYIIALPATIILWYIATAILIAIISSMHLHFGPVKPDQAYSQGFWYALEAAIVYLICSMILMINMLGYFLGHYPQTFQLNEYQRTLIVQTMLFFFWLAAGGAMFSAIQNKYGQETEHWNFANGLYFCDVTILTVGFGDLVPDNSIGRGLVLPYAVGGIIMLGLVISSLSRFAREMSQEKVVQHHIDHVRRRTRTRILEVGTDRHHHRHLSRHRSSIHGNHEHPEHHIHHVHHLHRPVRRRQTVLERAVASQPKLRALRGERDRFEAMRTIEAQTAKFKRWLSLSLSIVAYGIVWCVGAVVFWEAEKETQGMTFFQSLYFCYVSLLTIGYGQWAPQSAAGRAFFVLWSLFAVPTMTLLINAMHDTVIHAFKHGSFKLADWTVLPKAHLLRSLMDSFPHLRGWFRRKSKTLRKANREKQRAFPVIGDAEKGNGAADSDSPVAQPSEADGRPPSDLELARHLAVAIQRTADHLKQEQPPKYTYEEWVHITRLIRFTARQEREARTGGSGEETRLGMEEDDDDELVEWDWIGEKSPLMSGQSEPQFAMDRLCESLYRWVDALDADRRRREGGDSGSGSTADVLDDEGGRELEGRPSNPSRGDGSTSKATDDCDRA